MELVINGETQQAPEGTTAAALLNRLGLENERLAIEVNQEIVPRSQFETYTFVPGDRIEIVRAIGGGSAKP
ncbi:sulfur carrier protein ThiS [Thiogranum longum]|uniref:Sulfur carrier protein ThiS n=1 Tax=Thiogranum longum TaxID=1537524 RepID=A0A4R1HFD8_9GAMM|nr:sulfur carrier protein ThiS [Thiogranum longum]TCK19501.1 sulfur carrier protein ThiS [Thiogranum longum]